MKSIQYIGAYDVQMVKVAVPEPAPGWVRVKIAYAGICGSDFGMYWGVHPRAKPPVIMGHEMAGILDTPAEDMPVGTPVAINPLIRCGQCGPCKNGESHVCTTLRLYGFDAPGGMAEYVCVPRECVVCLPEGLGLDIGAMIEPIAVAVHAVRQAGFVAGGSVMVLGAGPIGLCVALVLRRFGANGVVVAENDATRLKMAADMGFDIVDTTDAQAVAAHKPEGGFDHVFDCAGASAAMALAFDVSRVQGQIVVVAAYKKPVDGLPFFTGMLKELSIDFVRVYRDQDFRIAIDIAQAEPLFAKLITHVLEPERAAEGFELLLTKGTGAVKVLYKF